MTNTAPDAAPVRDRSGVPGLDAVLSGGLPRGSLTLVVGPPGSGKSTLAAQVTFAAARAGRHGLLVTAFSEPNTKLLAHLRTFTFFDETLIGERIRVLSVQPYVDDGLDAVADALVAEARRLRVGLVVIDGFHGLRPSVPDGQAGRAFLYTVGTALNMLDATTLITSEAEPRDTALFGTGPSLTERHGRAAGS